MSQATESKPRLQTVPASHTPPEWLLLVQQHVRELRFGTVQITVHNGRVTQVDSTRRTRFGPENETPGNDSVS